MPISSARVNPLMFCGEIKKSATRTKTTVIEVLIDRASDWMMLRLTFCSKVRRLAWRKFSRIRSKITMVSCTEKPITVNAAVTNSVLISPSCRLKIVLRLDYGGLGRLLELDVELVAAGEVDAKAEAEEKHRDDARQDDRERQQEIPVAPSDDIHLGDHLRRPSAPARRRTRAGGRAAAQPGSAGTAGW